ncbi:ABC transporter permease [Lysinibacillus sphaericus]|uniref:ABC transporter permease n=1 Tax=Lysinibacillus sphaericus TaxID=1421 RepID=UPI001A9E112D|nr:ABC transporter permease [Lysinibacillus sphaericus]QTB20770.1 ABC transporter permease [Lysinibacillus sphaericus]
MNSNHDRFEELHASQEELLHQSAGKESHKIPFCCVISIPHGFEVISNYQPKIMYHLGCLATVEETCRKTVQVDDCGNAEVDLHVLKAKGCIPFIANIVVKPTCEQKGCSAKPHIKEIAISCRNSVCVDLILNCSVDSLSYINLNCHNVVVCDLQMTPIKEACQHVKIKGNFQFLSV